MFSLSLVCHEISHVNKNVCNSTSSKVWVIKYLCDPLAAQNHNEETLCCHSLSTVLKNILLEVSK